MLGRPARPPRPRARRSPDLFAGGCGPRFPPGCRRPPRQSGLGSRPIAPRWRTLRRRPGCTVSRPGAATPPHEDPRGDVGDAEDVIGQLRPDARQQIEDRARPIEAVAAIVHDVRQAQPSSGEAAVQHHLHVGVDEVGADAAGECHQRRRAAHHPRSQQRQLLRRQAPVQDRERRVVDLHAHRLVARDLRTGAGQHEMRFDARRHQRTQQAAQALVRSAHLLRERVHVKDAQGSLSRSARPTAPATPARRACGRDPRRATCRSMTFGDLGRRQAEHVDQRARDHPMAQPRGRSSRNQASTGISKPRLGRSVMAIRQIGAQHLAQQLLAAPHAGLGARRQGQAKLDQAPIEQWHAHLQAVRHRELVGLHQQVVEQHGVKVDVLQPLDVVERQVRRAVEEPLHGARVGSVASCRTSARCSAGVKISNQLR